MAVICKNPEFNSLMGWEEDEGDLCFIHTRMNVHAMLYALTERKKWFFSYHYKRHFAAQFKAGTSVEAVSSHVATINRGIISADAASGRGFP